MVSLKPVASSFGEPDKELASLALGEIMTSRRGLPADVAVLRKAIAVASQAHQGQVRTSGEPYITHPLKVAELVASLGVDEHSVVAAILHDAVEDSELSLDEVESQFGQDVRLIVDGVTKLDRLAFDSKEAQQAATIRKMMIAMASDPRVLLIKLADRLHNLQTIAALPEWKQRRTAQETLDVYAPLAHRLGVQQIKWQLEDRSFEVLHPKRFAEIEKMVSTRAPQREEFLERVLLAVRARLGELNIEAEVTGRPKHLWSIYEKMVVRGREFDEIFDLVGIRIIVDKEADCWAALGALHALWPPIQGRFKDYVNAPKFNLYQSLHSTLVGFEGKPIEVQIRTREMHRRAEYGIAAHLGYKSGNLSAADASWLQRVAELDEDENDPVRFLAALKDDLEQDEVYLFTPKGRVIALPSQSTPVDFAYAIHTEVGHRCIGARVDGRLVPLDTVLKSADTVEIITSKAEEAGPSRDWLRFAKSSRAKNKIRQRFSRERRADDIEEGRAALAKELRRAGLPVNGLLKSHALSTVATELSLEDLDALFAAIGANQASAQSVVQRVQRELQGDSEQVPTTVERRGLSHRSNRRGTGVFVEGLDDLMIHLARCCTPVPGDPIVGFVTRGRGVSIHRSDCANSASLATQERERTIEVEWDDATRGTYVATVEVQAFDRSRLLADVSQMVSESHLNIVAARTITTPDRVSRMAFDVELADPEHLVSLIDGIRQLDGVFDAYRVLPGSNS